MLDTSLYRPKTSRRFQSLMELYEENYRLIRLLIPALRTLEADLYVSQAKHALALELYDIQQVRYTTTFRLTYRFSEPLDACEPDLTLRLYHDARTCEVLSGLLPGVDKKYARRTRNLDDGYALNRFLNRWLSYCLRQGHSFGKPAAVEVSSKLLQDAAAAMLEGTTQPQC
ncbi:MAG: DUF1249 domain-containing protein [Gammaproteobacteria bacterium]|nr:DUF1249 domain-containing protein [Gammaproteobacteria bacterium]